MDILGMYQDDTVKQHCRNGENVNLHNENIGNIIIVKQKFILNQCLCHNKHSVYAVINGLKIRKEVKSYAI